MIRIKAGSRKSPLALLQTESALKKISEDVNFAFDIIPFSTPGDRDLKTDLRTSPGDFFTRDLDNALRSGEIDCAIHSAKDLPETMPPDIDWFWLPWQEDATDAWVLPRNGKMTDLPRNPRIGISSERRCSYAKTKFPKADFLPIRGSINSRLEQLDRGDFDILIMATAALNRLGMTDRISGIIPISELTPPAGQGFLAVTFQAENKFWKNVRKLYTKAVRFIGAGVGSAELCTIAGLRELKLADVCIFDTLLGDELVNATRKDCIKIFAGKRAGSHSMQQTEITQTICDWARRGKRVVRLKGGDPGFFGRLTEEISALENLEIPFRVWPGVSALNAATSATGMLLTERAVSSGFSVITPRSTSNAPVPYVYFMALKCVNEIVKSHEPDTPVAIVSNAGAENQRIERLKIKDLNSWTPKDDSPGLIIVGNCATKHFPENSGALHGRKIWATSSIDLQEKVQTAILDRGGIPIFRPLIKLEMRPEAESVLRRMKEFDDLIVTSPASARLLLSSKLFSLRDLPRICVCGPGTAAVFEEFGIHCDIMPKEDFSTRGLKNCLPDLTGRKVLRVRSNLAEWTIGEDCVLYENQALIPEKIPDCDAVFFASASAVKVLFHAYGKTAFDGKTIIAMGSTTGKALMECGITENVIVSKTSTIDSTFHEYARTFLS